MILINQPGRSAGYLAFLVVMMGLFSSMAQAQDATIDKPAKALQPVNIEITSHLGDQQSFADQDVISFLISLDRAAFLYVFYQDASDNLYQLMPGKAQAEHYFQPGFYISFPPQDSAFQFVVQAPFGEEQLWVFASDHGQLEFKDRDSGQGIKQLTQRPLELATSIRAASQRLFGQAQLIIHTHSR